MSLERCRNCNGEYDRNDITKESFRCLGGGWTDVCPECLRQLRQEERRFLENEKREKAEAERERKREEAEARESERQRRAALTPEERRAEDVP